jgi:hypothetical protein
MAMLVLVLACSGLLAAGLLPEALRLDEREHAYFDRHPFDQPRKPRLWAQGWLIDDVPARRGTGGPPAQPTR